jgi:hypothetical protein
LTRVAVRFAVDNRSVVDQATDFLDTAAIGAGGASIILAALGADPAALVGLEITAAASTLGTVSEGIGLALSIADPNATGGEIAVRAFAVGLGLSGGQIARTLANKAALRELLRREFARAGLSAEAADQAAGEVINQLENHDPANRMQEEVQDRQGERDEDTGICPASESNCN